MIEQTIPLRQLTAGMANCIRDWILPHLTDAMARIQADQLITMLNELPQAVAPAALARIKADSAEARVLLVAAGLAPPAPAANDHVDELMAENARLKQALEALAAQCRAAGDEASRATLRDLQRFFVASAKREGEGAAVSQFEDLTTRDREGKQDLHGAD